MSEQKVVEVRQTRSSEHRDDEREAIHWIKDDGLAGDLPRGILFTGVPMVGDRVMVPRWDNEIITVRAMRLNPDGSIEVNDGSCDDDWILTSDCSPVPDEDEALVDEVREAIELAYKCKYGVSVCDDDALARAAIAAVRKHMEADHD